MPSGIPPKQRTPGGDFGWLRKTYTFTVGGSPTIQKGRSHGHNIVAADNGYAADSHNAVAPAGTFPSTELGCTSCHDPHGKYRRKPDDTITSTGAPIIAAGSFATNSTPGYAEPPAAGTALGVYRLLGGAGYTKGGITFTGVPAAKAPNTYNRTEANTQTRTAYVRATTGGHASWDNWCATCHVNMHSDSGSSLGHPADRALGATIASTYKTYVKSGDMTGDGINGFTSLVPFVEQTDSYTTLASHARNDDTYLGGPTGTDRVTCLSCHRAHASGWEFGLRWDYKSEYLTYNNVYPGTYTTPNLPQYARGRMSAETQAAYYDRPITVFATYQRGLCNKCHAKD